jgi:hypothetical protein
MGRNKKLTKAVRERMALTGENYTAARTALLAAEPIAEWFEVTRVEDLESGSGDEAALWRTLEVRYVIRTDGLVVDETGARAKRFALDPGYTGWMRALVGQRAGGLRRIEGAFAPRTARGPFFTRGGACTIEARLLSVAAYSPEPPVELVRGEGREAVVGDRVRVRYALRLRDTILPAGVASGPIVASSGEAGLWVTVGAGEIEPGIDRVIPGMRAGGSRTAVLPPDGDVPERWLWLDLLEMGG